ncbi:MAG: PKD domain-containing protein, partial [Candidatus Eisenbacteria sp.]|nr:PKD domain-containing protein [Candidatus Eisenbacteria bacterium]
SFAASWQPATSAVQYEIRHGTSCGSGDVIAASGTSHEVTVAGGSICESYYWQVRGQNECGTWGSWSACNSVIPSEQPVACFTADLTQVCVSDVISFTDCSDVCQPTSWHWDFGDGNSSPSPNPTKSYDVPGTFTVSLTVINDCGQDTYESAITVCGEPSIASADPSEGEPGDTVISISGDNFWDDPDDPSQFYVCFEGGATVCCNELPDEHWTDDWIQLTVPSAALTGNAYVSTKCGQCSFPWTPVDLSLLSATAEADGVTLEWYGAAGSGTTYDIYRALGSLEGDYELLASVEVSGDGLHTYEDESVVPGNIHCYSLGVQGWGSLTAPICVDVPQRLPTRYSLVGAAPNPFNPSTSIFFDVPEPGGRVELTIYNLSGRKVAQLSDRHWAPGRHSVLWQGRNTEGAQAACGVYMCRMESAGGSSSIKITLLE